MAVPASPTGNVVALHSAVAREDILENASFNVVRSGHAICGGRAFVKDPAWAITGLHQTAFEDVIALPQVKDLMFNGGQINVRGNGTVTTGHQWPSG